MAVIRLVQTLLEVIHALAILAIIWQAMEECAKVYNDIHYFRMITKTTYRDIWGKGQCSS